MTHDIIWTKTNQAREVAESGVRVFLVVGVAVAVLSVLLVITLRSVTVASLTPSEIEEINRDFLKLSGVLEISNGGLLPLQVSRGSITLLLADDGTRLSLTDFPGFWLPPGHQRAIPFALQVEWEPTTRIAKDLIAGGRGTLILEGSVVVLHLFSLSYRNSFDLKPLLVELVRQGSDALVDLVRHRLQELWNRIRP